MWGERLKRILIILGAVVLTLVGVSAVRRWQERKKVAGESTKLPTEILTDKIEEVGKGILDKAVEILPADDKLKKEIVKEITKEEIKEKVVETQTKEIIEILKELPGEQLEKIKKQIFKDFCEKVMGE